MISYREAIEIITAQSRLLEAETVSIENAIGRILTENILSPEVLPPFSNSAMDGFAYRQKDLDHSERWTLNIQGTLAAGDSFSPEAKTAFQGAWEIMTGAQVPSDCDCVIKVEETQRNGSQVTLLKRGSSGDNLREAGTDFKVGDPIAVKGTRLLPEHLMAFAALGIPNIQVRKRPTVSILSTGSELAESPEKGSGKIRNSTAPYLVAELRALGAEPTFLGVVEDEPRIFIDHIKAQVEKGTDILLSTGAVSMGKYDFVASALRDLGAEIFFHKVAIRPGKPLIFARLGKTVFFGIPGNPVSTNVSLRFFIEPYLRASLGLPKETAKNFRIKTTIQKPEGLKCFFKAQSIFHEGQGEVSILAGQESFRIAPLLLANAWAILPEAGTEVSSGTLIEVLPLHSWTEKETL